MSIDFNKLESIASTDNINYKRYRDLNFLFKKLHYLIKNFEEEYPKELDNLKKYGKENSIVQMKQTAKTLGIPIEKFYKPDVKLAVGFFGEMTNPLFFNFDSIMIDAKRVIEFFIKFLAVCMNKNTPEKIQNFFKGLKNELTTTSIFCDTLNEEYRGF